MGSVVLVHGWGGSFASTWGRSGFSVLLEDGGKEVIGVDLLGHGEAPKPHEPEAYADLTERLFDALPDEPVEAVGFSLGALTLLRAAIAHPERFSRVVLAGIALGAFCIYSVWQYLDVVGFTPAGGWLVSGSDLMRYVIPFDMVAAIVAVIVLWRGAHAGLRTEQATLQS